MSKQSLLVDQKADLKLLLSFKDHLDECLRFNRVNNFQLMLDQLKSHLLDYFWMKEIIEQYYP